MKYIDPKSLTIGVLAASLVFACTDSNNKTTNSPSLVSEAKAATSKADAGKWDDKQEWTIQMQKRVGSRASNQQKPIGFQPFAVNDEGWIYWRKRLK